ncbi:MAG: prepilin-type N-terminal cleavage/methylation domain-containing protein [bacterium]
MKKILQKGFTLIELLIVIGILGILIAAVLFSINPAEGQRKARDVQRLKDLGTLQVIIEQLVSADAIPAGSSDTLLTSASEISVCGATNWLGVDICDYAGKVPVDPVNKQTSIAGTAGSGGCTAALSTHSGKAYYYIWYDAANTNTYEIGVVQESAAGCTKVLNDGGNSDSMVEIGTNTSLDLIDDPDGYL